MIKIKLSGETRQELEFARKLLSPYIKTYREPKGQNGQYIRAYVELKENKYEQKG